MRARRREVVDAYLEDGRAAIYTSRGMVVLLSELATSAWCQLGEGWMSAETLAEHLVSVFGDPAGTASRLTEETLISLAEMSLVELDDPDSSS